VARDGREIDVEARLSALTWAGGPATLVTLRRNDATAAAPDTGHDLDAVLDAVSDGVLTLDATGRILAINRRATELLGYAATEVVGGPLSLVLAPESRRAAFDYLDEMKTAAGAAAAPRGREVLGLVRRGGAIPLHLTLGPLGAATEARFCAVLRDVSPWKQVEEDLRAAKRQAERASAHKSDFLAKVSHEIRTPLNAIIGFAEVMMEERLGSVGNERYKDYLRDIHMSGQHLISLVNDLLDLSKIESGKIELELTDVDLNEAVSQSVALLQPQANRERIIVRTSLARGLPRVRADRRSVRQIVLNLASNAVKFTPGGGQVIVATAINDHGEPVIRVRDTGQGMSRKDIAQALEPFRRLPVSGHEGAGLGLPLTKALAEANQARFDIRSAVGEGTLVEIAFPAIARAVG
ncbi:histidine kinase dimerization/phospho-acceptor domain-containing protein, partial [Methylopila musalis]